jgi:hypothetical protein
MSKDKAQSPAKVSVDFKRARTASNEIRRAAKVQREAQKKLARKQRLEAEGKLVAKGTARAKRRGSMKHYMVDYKAKTATLTTYGAKPAEGVMARVVFAPSQKAALLACGIKPKEVSDKTVAKKIVASLKGDADVAPASETGLVVKKPRAKKGEAQDNTFALAA